MVAMEGVCLAFMLVVITAYIVLPRSKGLRKDWFFYSLVLTILGLVFDIVSWGSELGPASEFIQYAANFLALITTSLIVSAFGYYITELINEKKPLSKKFADAISIINLLGISVTAAAAVRGSLFDVKVNPSVPGGLILDDGGFFYELPMSLAILSLALLFVLILCNAKTLGRQKLIVFTIYFMIPLVVGVLELVVPNLLLSYVAISLSISIIYAMLQSSHMDELLLRDKLLNEISYLDQLTGLLNRRAYDRDIDLIKNNDRVTLVFCDLNGLKQINDEEGHSAGDQLLITFANILTRHFPHESVYRISGDEFVVVQCNVSAGESEKRIAQLRQDIISNSGIASVGTATGTGYIFSRLVNRAETDMYEDKKKYYLQNPGSRRGKAEYLSSTEE